MPETAALPLTADQYWKYIVSKMQASPEWQMRVAAHVRAKTGHMNPASYHHNGAADEEKRALYQIIATAIMKNDPSMLEGDVARGQAVAVPAVKAPGIEPTFERKPEPVAETEPAPIAVVSAEIADAFGMRGLPNTVVIPELDALRKLREGFEAIGLGSQPAKVDQAAIASLVEKSIAPKLEAWDKAQMEMSDTVRKLGEQVAATAEALEKIREIMRKV